MKKRWLLVLGVLFILLIAILMNPTLVLDIKDDTLFFISTLQSTSGIEFDSVYYLEEWLANNTVSENIYTPITYDCDNFAMDLYDDARIDGYIMKTEYQWIESMRVFHARCKTVINGIWYTIEPQTDEITMLK